jgi:hypothetical protein
VTAEECEEHWVKQFDSSAKVCSHAFWKGNCKNRSVGMECEVGLRRKTYNVLTGEMGKRTHSSTCKHHSGSVLSVWMLVENVLTNDGQKKGQHAKMQVVRMRLDDGRRIVGTLIPTSAVDLLVKQLGSGAEENEEIIH